MKYVWMILRTDLVSVLNKSKGGTKDKLQLALLPILWLVLAGGAFYGTRLFFRYLEPYLAAIPGMADAVALKFLNSVAVYVILFVFLGGFQTTFRIIYESDDIGFLLSQPVPSHSVFAAKFITAYLALLPMVLIFGGSTWFAWGSFNRAGLGFYVMVMLSFMLLLLLIHGAIALLLLLAMRYLPGAKLKRLFVALAAIVGMLVVLWSQLMSSRLSSSENPMGMLMRIESENLFGRWYLPTTWCVNSILGMLDRFGVKAYQYAVPLACSALAVAWLAVKVSNRAYFAGWSSTLEEGPSRAGAARRAARRRKGSGAARAWGLRSSGMQGALWTILRKDVRLLFRDPVLWYGLGTSSIALGSFAYNLIRRGGGEYSLGDQGMLSYLSMMTVCLLGAVVGGQTGGISLSREGSSLWLLQANPVDGKSLFRAKMVYAVLPSMVLIVPFFTVLEFSSVPVYPLWRNLLVGASIATIIALSQILLDTFFPDFTIRVELGSSKGTGKLLVVLLARMGMAIALSVVLLLPSILVSKGIYPQSSLARLNAIVHGGLLASALLMAYLGSLVGSKQAAKLLRPN